MESESSSTQRCEHSGAGRLDVEAFPRFAPLLTATQEYAGLSGSRFRSGSFDHLLGKAEAPPEPPPGSAAAERLAAKCVALPSVREFIERLQAEEEDLMEEMERASRIVMGESVRNAMVAAFRKLDMWPPSPCPEGVDEADCAYEDTSAPLEVMAQRAYNDELRRPRCKVCGIDKEKRRAATASYVVDFTHDAGVPLPPMPETYETMLMEFTIHTAEWEEERRGNLADAVDLSPDHPEQESAASRRSKRRATFERMIALGAAAKTSLAHIGSSFTGPVAGEQEMELLPVPDEESRRNVDFLPAHIGPRTASDDDSTDGQDFPFLRPSPMDSDEEAKTSAVLLTDRPPQASGAFCAPGASCEEEQQQLEPEEPSTLFVEILAASDLGLPEFRFGDNLAHRRSSSLQPYVEIQVGKHASKTGCGLSAECERSVEFRDERLYFRYESEPELTIRVRDRRRMQALFRGDPLIGETVLPLGRELHNFAQHVVDLPIWRSHSHKGSVSLRYQLVRPDDLPLPVRSTVSEGAENAGGHATPSNPKEDDGHTVSPPLIAISASSEDSKEAGRHKSCSVSEEVDGSIASPHSEGQPSPSIAKEGERQKFSPPVRSVGSDGAIETDGQPPPDISIVADGLTSSAPVAATSAASEGTVGVDPHTL